MKNKISMTSTKFQFEANVQKLLKLVTHTVYQEKDIAIRELISNASDAYNKLVQAYNTNSVENLDEGKIQIHLNKKDKQIIISDNGIGLTKDEMIQNLGCIANSGTEKFLESLKDKKSANMIGKFGIGFYAAFLIAKEVKFYSRSAMDQSAKWHVWSSDGENGYSISTEEHVLSKEVKHGSILVLDVKEEEFLDAFKIKNVVKKYSDHIDTQITFIEGDKNETINDGKAIWLKSKNDISEEEYLNFAKNKFYHSDKPLSIIHNFLEGAFEYINLFYIPLKKGMSFVQNKTKADIHLYINRVFISSESIQILPRFLRFVFGIVDCPSLHLNISRENIQNNAVLKKLQNASVKKILESLQYESRENRSDYEEFFTNYGEVIKEGLCDPASYNYDEKTKEMILKSCLFFSAKEKKMISVEEFNEAQESILYINAKSREEGLGNIQVEKALAQGKDVLILTDHVDNFWSGNGFVFNKKSFTSVHHISKEEREEQEKQSKDSDLCKKIKEILGSKVQNVLISDEASSSPVSLISNSMNNMSAQMEQYLIQQNHIKERSIPSLQVHVKHAIIQALEKNMDAKNFKIIIQSLFDQAKLSAGEEVLSVKDFRANLNTLILDSLKTT